MQAQAVTLLQSQALRTPEQGLQTLQGITWGSHMRILMFPEVHVRKLCCTTCTDALLALSERLYFQSWTSWSRAAISTRCAESPWMHMKWWSANERRCRLLPTTSCHGRKALVLYRKPFLASQTLGKISDAVNMPAGVRIL